MIILASARQNLALDLRRMTTMACGGVDFATIFDCLEKEGCLETKKMAHAFLIEGAKGIENTEKTAQILSGLNNFWSSPLIVAAFCAGITNGIIDEALDRLATFVSERFSDHYKEDERVLLLKSLGLLAGCGIKLEDSYNILLEEKFITPIIVAAIKESLQIVRDIHFQETYDGSEKQIAENSDNFLLTQVYPPKYREIYAELYDMRVKILAPFLPILGPCVITYLNIGIEMHSLDTYAETAAKLY